MDENVRKDSRLFFWMKIFFWLIISLANDIVNEYLWELARTENGRTQKIVAFTIIFKMISFIGLNVLLLLLVRRHSKEEAQQKFLEIIFWAGIIGEVVQFIIYKYGQRALIEPLEYLLNM